MLLGLFFTCEILKQKLDEKNIFWDADQERTTSFLASLGLHGVLGKVVALFAAALALALPAQFVQTL